ncbi:MAG: radical SAM family heme chaperone HemW [Alphaproteobacteria bacterium]|nr:radical SAM family heme chaperone HemW [Alphaproteobacteria bacterium]
MNNYEHNIYIHVPFCKSKCNYCAFFSHACSAPDWEKYTDEICGEIEHWGIQLGKIDVPTVFFGGGTPSLMPPKSFQKIIGCIHKNFRLAHDAEITLESNPGTLNADKIQEFKNAGMNRLSIGVQSLDDNKLKFMGRCHNAQDALNLIHMAQNMRLRVSADFIYGLPGDTAESVVELCKQINNIGLKHVSMYELTIEKNTPFGRMNLDMPSNEEMAKMYIAIDKHLALPRYEVSNYCAPGHECRHNKNIWDGAPYIGIGHGAAGRVFIDNTWHEQLGGGVRFEKISNDTRAIEMILTGMRTISGCQLTDDVKNVIDIDWVLQHPEHVTIQNNRISATAQGILILDDIVVNIIR